MDISVVIPVYNEEGAVAELYDELTKVLSKITSEYEIIFVDDGSTDTTYNRILDIKKVDNHIKVISFEKNRGKSSALMAGFEAASGEIVFTMDGDLQDDPNEIPRFINMMSNGYDLVCGWKSIRYDPLSKTAPSKVFNWLTTLVTGAKVHDSNCGFKAYKNNVVKDLNLQKGFHRYIPALVQWHGYKISEIKVTHHPREHGTSKYGPERLVTGLIDLINLKVKYSKDQKPE
jgi:glycosyltransferase involved in cell wall biosynthesis